MKNRLLISAFFLLIALIIPFLAISGVLMPEYEKVNTWFQRSGSLTVIFAAISEVIAFSVVTKLEPSGTRGDQFYKFKGKYGVFVKALKVSALLVIMIGTFVWGYGDIFLK